MRLRFVSTFLALAVIASGHFVFVVPQPGGATAQVFINEELTPSQEVDVALIGQAKLTLRDAEGRETPLTLVKGDHVYVTALPGGGTRLVHGVVDLGLTQRGTDKSYLLVYYPKTIVGDPFDSNTTVMGKTPVEIVPIGKPGAVSLKVLAHGKPQPGAEVTIILPDGKQKKLMTGEEGQTDALTQTGRYGAWARYWEPVGGERDGKSYSETRNYATLVFDVSTTSATSPSASVLTATQFAKLPLATSSFGAVVNDGWLYVYGGHISPTHAYSTEAVSGQFARLNLSGGLVWEQLPSGPALQGMNLAAHGGKVYRIGGMTPRNKPGEPAANYSVADCARFDAKTMKWESLPSLPEPRSSHDVVIVGDKLIVVGGWSLNGAGHTAWFDTLEVLDLAAERLEWKSAAQPFKRRALIAASSSGRMYALGGFDEHSKIVREVALYDPQRDAWTKGPQLPGREIDSFAPAACIHHGNLYVSVADGTLYRLNESKQEWEKAGSATPRLAHRIVSHGNTILIIGGASKGINSDLIEAVVVAG